MSMSTLLDYELSNPYDQPAFIDELLDLPENNQDESEKEYNALDICLGITSPNVSGFSDYIDTPNLSDTCNIIQNNKSDLSSCLSPDNNLNDIIPPKEPDKIRKDKGDSVEKQARRKINKAEKMRKRQYRSSERALFNKLRDLFPNELTKTKHQLLREAIEEIQSNRKQPKATSRT